MVINWDSKKILKFRKDSGLSQRDFAWALGLDRQQTISEWEAGRTPQKAGRILLGILYEKFKRGEIKPRAE